MSRTHCFFVSIVALNALMTLSTLQGQELTTVSKVDRQPLMASVRRVEEALKFAGAPFSESVTKRLNEIDRIEQDRRAVRELQKLLDPLCIVEVHINPESRVKVAPGPVKKELMQHGWRSFLVKVRNEAGINPELIADSPQAAPVYMRGKSPRQRPATVDKLVDASEIPDRFLDLSMLKRQPMTGTLSGLELEYQILMISSRDTGKREAALSFNVGQGTQDIGFRNAVPILFSCLPAVAVKLQVLDFDGSPTTASFVVKDDQERVYPNVAKRLAPDFFFHEQVYRADGETLLLPPGEYTVSAARGPEYLPVTGNITVPDAPTHTEVFRMERWIHAAKHNWYSGDHHVHAAGCSHYDSPTEGVGPEDMIRHILGEDLNVGCVLSWGPCWYTQKEFFEGQVHSLSTPDNLMRYDVEVSGFPSSHAGHLCLLNLNDDDYPGTKSLEEWPSWTYPVLKWTKDQGGVAGYSHSGWGLSLPDIMPNGDREFSGQKYGGAAAGWKGKCANQLPDYAMPRFNGIGANEYVVTTALGVCDFISAVDTPVIWELNVWYHTLNCGMTSRISGETDFPCIYGERVGLGRIYVKLEDEELSYETWVDGLRDGRSYCCDGLSHLMNFRVNDLGVGERGPGGDVSRLDIDGPQTVQVTFDAAAMLQESPTKQTEAIRGRRLDEKPYWHLERARIGHTRTVPVEIIVNGEVASTIELVADGHIEAMSVPVELEQSSWVAVRILASCHTNPVFVHIGTEPIRANRRSAEWCVEAVETCWNSKKDRIREEERQDAKDAYNQATAIYKQILAESSQ
ncbi:MAG: CehA/McbA family metallohydrolase [Fuerstiella sp.]|nr:CehA/McbA family metallohydrolase [Fuerstiella sp.]